MDMYGAGLIDGEGYIGIRMNRAKGRLSASVELAIGMADKGLPALQRMANRYGGRVTTHKQGNPRYREAWKWARTGSAASAVLREVLPDLLVKRDVAEIALELQAMIDRAEKRENGNALWTKEMQDAAAVYSDRIKELNRRGPDPDYPKAGLTATYHAGMWWSPNDSLFGPTLFEGRIPRNGRMVAGRMYAIEN